MSIFRLPFGLAFVLSVGLVAGFNVHTLSPSTSLDQAVTSRGALQYSSTSLNVFKQFKRPAVRESNDSDEDPDQKVAGLSAKDDDKEESLIQVESLKTSKPDSAKRLRRLKDLVWVREALEDLTAAEFACAVESGSIPEEEKAKNRRKRAVDYEKLLNQLNRRINDLGCDFASEAVRDASFVCALTPGKGSAGEVYSDEERQTLLERLIRTRKNLIEVIQGYEITLDEQEVPFELELKLPELRVEIPREKDDPTSTSSSGPKLYVREDGTVDWDGALQDQAALRSFGSAVWARINGREPESVDEADGDSSHGKKPAVMVQIVETLEIKEAREKMISLREELVHKEAQHTALLNSAISAGQAVAQVNMASLDPVLRNKIMSSADDLEKSGEALSFQTLVYELERIYSYLSGELGNPTTTGYISLQDRLNIAEFGLLESQVESFRRQLDQEEVIDRDVLAVVSEQMNDFKRRLGIDYLITGLSFDSETIMRWLAKLWETTKKTLAFYGKGCRLFWNDIVFTLSLITRAAQGYTLKPREVRTIR